MGDLPPRRAPGRRSPLQSAREGAQRPAEHGHPIGADDRECDHPADVALGLAEVVAVRVGDPSAEPGAVHLGALAELAERGDVVPAVAGDRLLGGDLDRGERGEGGEHLVGGHQARVMPDQLPARDVSGGGAEGGGEVVERQAVALGRVVEADARPAGAVVAEDEQIPPGRGELRRLLDEPAEDGRVAHVRRAPVGQLAELAVERLQELGPRPVGQVGHGAVGVAGVLVTLLAPLGRAVDEGDDPDARGRPANVEDLLEVAEGGVLQVGVGGHVDEDRPVGHRRRPAPRPRRPGRSPRDRQRNRHHARRAGPRRPGRVHRRPPPHRVPMAPSPPGVSSSALIEQR